MKIKILLTGLLVSVQLILSAQKWTPISGLSGNIYSSIEIQNGTLVGTGSGIFITKDNGATYKEYSIGMPSGNIRAISKLNSSLFCIIEDKGIYSSNDNGIHWTLSRKGKYSYTIQTSSNVIYIRSDTLFYSKDDGKTWRNTPIKDNSQSKIYAAADKLWRYQYSASPAGIFESSDTGKTWLPNSNGFKGFLSIITQVNGKIYALNQHIYQLNSNGTGWMRLTTDSLTYSYKFGSITFSPEYFTVLNGTIYGRNGGTAFLKLAKWKPGDNAWSSFDNGLNYASSWNFNLYSLFPSGNKLLLSQNDTLMQTTELNSWKVQPTAGLNSVKVYGFTIDNNVISCFSKTPFKRNTFNFAKTLTYLIEAKETDLNWKREGALEFAYTDELKEVSLYHIGDTLLSVYDYFVAIYNKTKKTSTQKTIGLYTTPIAKIFNFNDSLYFYGTDGSGTGGGTISQVRCFSKDFKFSESRGLGAGRNLGDYAEMISIIKHKNTLFELSREARGAVSEISKYSKETPKLWWKQVTIKINGQNFAANAIGDWKGRLYLGLKNGAGVMFSEDEGKTWTKDNNGLVNCTPTCFLSLGDTLLMGSEAGIYAKISSNSNWIDITGSLPASTIKKIDNTRGLIVAQIDGGGLWVLNRQGFTTGLKKHIQPGFKIYPNPSNGLVYVDSNEQIRSVKIYSLNGKLMNDINFNDNTIDVSQLINGIYFIQINNTTQKLIINK